MKKMKKTFLLFFISLSCFFDCAKSQGTFPNCLAGAYAIVDATSTYNICVWCPNHHYCPGANWASLNANKKVPCPGGTEYFVGVTPSNAAQSSSNCYGCVSGWYSTSFLPDMGKGCVMCPTGHQSNDIEISSLKRVSCNQCGLNTWAKQNILKVPDHKCRGCSSNSYSSTDRSSCLAPAGYYCTSAATCGMTQNLLDNPIACPSGSYSSGGTTSCTPCGAGKYTDGKTECQTCPAGSYSLSGDFICRSCVPGNYADTAGSTSCKSCPTGTFTSQYGATSCSTCPAGSALSSDKSSCTPCPAGQYNDVIGSSTCKACTVAGTYSAPGSTACTYCPLGSVPSTDKSSCTVCPAGSYAVVGSSSCDKCPINTYSPLPGSSSCPICPAGTSSNVLGAAVCPPCAEGSYSINGAAAQCDKCPLGYSYVKGTTISRISLSSACTPCPAGTYNNAQNGLCSNCLANTFSAAAGSTSCTNCATGRTSVPGSSTCQCDSTSWWDGTSCSSVKKACDVGQYIITPHTSTVNVVCGTCTKAPNGYYLTGCKPDVVGDLKTWSPCLTCESGFYMKTAPGNCDGTGISGTVNDRSCEPCKNCANLEYILSTSKCPGNTLVDTTQCGACKSPCTYGQYIGGTLEEQCDGRGVGDTFQCLNCDTCAAGLGPSPSAVCNGKTRSSDQKCIQCSSCAEGKYVSQGCSNGGTTPICSNCNNCPKNYYISKPCQAGYSMDPDGRECTACGSCKAGQYIVSSSCDGSSKTSLPAVCGECPKCPGGYTPSKPCDGTGVTSDQVCVECEPCQVGEYIETACDGTIGSKNVCKKCADCPVGQYKVGCDGKSRTDVRTCSACDSTCPAGKYRAAECDGTTTYPQNDANCLDCKCKQGFYKSSVCDGLSTIPDPEGTCSACESCGSGNYISSGCDGTGTSSSERVCETCTLCNQGEFPEYTIEPCSGIGFDKDETFCGVCDCDKDFGKGNNCSSLDKFRYCGRDGKPLITTTTPPPSTMITTTTPSPTPKNPSPMTTPKSSTSSGLSAGASAGIAIGVILAVVGIAVGVIYATNNTIGSVWASITGSGNVGGEVEGEVPQADLLQDTDKIPSKIEVVPNTNQPSSSQSNASLLVFPQIFKVSEMAANVGDYNTMNKREELKNRRDLTWKSLRV